MSAPSTSTGPDQQKKVGQLSGGERNRVHLAKMLKEGGNVLLLDEPTNDLDVETLRALEEALENFAGCAVIISHDRFFLDRLATHILAFEGDSHVEWFEGNFEAYEEDKIRRLGPEADRPHRMTYQEAYRKGWTGGTGLLRHRADFRRWLKANHETAPELLVGFWKKGSGKASIDWPQARDQALCFGGSTGCAGRWARTPTPSASRRGARAASGARSTSSASMRSGPMGR